MVDDDTALAEMIGIVLSGAFRRVLLGILLGLPLAVGAGYLLSAQLYGVAYWDPAALVVASVSLTIAAFVASIVPVWIAQRLAGGTALTSGRQAGGTVAAAIEQQGATTEEIVRSVARAAEGTEAVTGNITDVSKGTEETGGAAEQVLGEELHVDLHVGVRAATGGPGSRVAGRVGLRRGDGAAGAAGAAADGCGVDHRGASWTAVSRARESAVRCRGPA